MSVAALDRAKPLLSCMSRCQSALDGVAPKLLEEEGCQLMIDVNQSNSAWHFKNPIRLYELGLILGRTDFITTALCFFERVYHVVK